MSNKTQLHTAVIGAGPYGLSVSAHLQEAGIEYRVFGDVMETWRRHMPPGMCLKSYGESSNLFDARAQFPLRAFAQAHRTPYHPSQYPVPLATFAAYGEAFQQRYVRYLTRARLISHRAVSQGHELQFDNGETVLARRVIVAVGSLPLSYLPRRLADLPAELLSHSSEFGPLTRLAGKRVIIVGSGASGLDLAALLSLQDSAVTIVARATELHFQNPPGPARSMLKRIVAPDAPGLGAGWLLRACTVPQLVRRLPDRLRIAILNNTLGPCGGYFIREQIESTVRLKLGRAIEQVHQHGGRVQVRLIDRGGLRTTIAGDHLIAATGYRIDLRQLPFLGSDTLQRVRMVDWMPVLSRDFESSLPGLFFVGLASARTFGPIMRFVAGAVHPARQLARALKNTPRRDRLLGVTDPGAGKAAAGSPVSNTDGAAA